MLTANRRQETRNSTGTKVWYRTEKNANFQPTVAIDVSFTGVRVMTQKPIMSCDLVVRHENGLFESVSAVTRWSVPIGKSYILGLAFDRA